MSGVPSPYPRMRVITYCSVCSRPWWQVHQDMAGRDAVPYCSSVPDWQFLGLPSPKEQGRLLAERLFGVKTNQPTGSPRRNALRASQTPRRGFIARTKAANRVEEVAAKLTDLRPAGRGRHKGLCPYHPEKTASFFVFEDSQRFQCFGCQKRGDVIDLMKQTGELNDRRYNY